MDNKYDQMVNALMINMYSLGKEEGEVCLYNFNRYDPRHLAAIHIASMLKDIMGIKISVKTSLFNYLWMKWKFKKIHNIGRGKKGNVDIEKELHHIEKTYEATNRFADIYKEYYFYTDRD